MEDPGFQLFLHHLAVVGAIAGVSVALLWFVARLSATAHERAALLGALVVIGSMATLAGMLWLFSHAGLGLAWAPLAVVTAVSLALFLWWRGMGIPLLVTSSLVTAAMGLLIAHPLTWTVLVSDPLFLGIPGPIKQALVVTTFWASLVTAFSSRRGRRGSLRRNRPSGTLPAKVPNNTDAPSRPRSTFGGPPAGVAEVAYRADGQLALVAAPKA